MGLQGSMYDISSDSIPLLFVALIANFIGNLRSYLRGLFKTMGLSRLAPDHIDPGLAAATEHLGSGLAGLAVLSEQLKFNRLFSYKYSCGDGGGTGVADSGGVAGAGGGGGNSCVVCFCSLRDGEQVRKLDCRHVFHKECFDGWLDHLHFNCPLCRSPLVSEDHLHEKRRRVAADLIQWFSSC